MKNKDFTIKTELDQSPETIFNAINNVRGWWSAIAVEGESEKPGDEFTYRHKDIHYSKQRLTEVVPNKKVVWLVTEGDLNFVEVRDEWVGTTISFEIVANGDKTELHFTHHGLTPETPCYEACSGGWDYYIKGSLLPLITTGKGKPDQ